MFQAKEQPAQSQLGPEALEGPAGLWASVSLSVQWALAVGVTEAAAVLREDGEAGVALQLPHFGL